MGLWPLFGCDHKWNKWNKPYRGNTLQQRKCRKCGKLQIRKVRPCLFGSHRWRMDRRTKPRIYRCKKCPATKPVRKVTS